MKVLIVSDTHGRHAGIEEAIEREKPFHMLIHLGDAEGYEDYIQELAGCPMEIVSGNNDHFSQLPTEKELLIDGLRIFITHGHYYFVALNNERIRQEGLKRQADVVMFGHTHRPFISEEEGITLLNPGSLAFPRQEGRQYSYIVMEKKHGEKPVFEVKYLD
jgi:hypothetical protein